MGGYRTYNGKGCLTMKNGFMIIFISAFVLVGLGTTGCDMLTGLDEEGKLSK